MSWSRYQRLCDQPQVLSRWVLERTLAVLGGGPVAAILEDVLAGQPLPRPSDHRGPAATDMYLTTLSPAQVEPVLEAVLRADAEGRLPALLGLSRSTGFVVVWHEYARWAAAQPDPAAPGPNPRDPVPREC